MHKKGQALVEFVIILPVLILMLLVIVDVGEIIYNQINLENDLTIAITHYKNNEETSANLEINMDTSEYIEFKLTKEINVLTPGLNLLLGNPYKITSKRVVYNE